jgi:hydroxymethylglutaryl-CoA reductase (NADPH)
MVTIATQAVCDYIKNSCPVPIQQLYVEGNLSGDKKASSQAYTSVRGRKVTAEVVLTPALLDKYVHATPRQLIDYWRMAAIGGVRSGTMGVQGHFANGLAALYIATGQDAACVAESAMGVTRFEETPEGNLYASVTLPGVMVGTVGGGTGLPSQKACLNLMGLHGSGNSAALAEVCAGLLLGGELSIIAALATGDFTKAHHKLAR